MIDVNFTTSEGAVITKMQIAKYIWDRRLNQFNVFMEGFVEGAAFPAHKQNVVVTKEVFEQSEPTTEHSDFDSITRSKLYVAVNEICYKEPAERINPPEAPEGH